MRRAAAIVVASPRFILTPAREARATAIRAASRLPIVLFVGRFA
jgi:hypothetical protein